MTKKRHLAAAALTAAVGLVLSVTWSPPPAGPGQPASGGRTTVVRTDEGAVRGTVLAVHRVFRGVPYAGPPTGAHRWAAPRPVRSWRGVRDATQPGPLCPQVPTQYGGTTSLEEDCLVLNVTAPAGPARGRGAPVLV
ncbi:hypothetical protein SGLAM104S_05891 [Streptomyces glaucescens]